MTKFEKQFFRLATNFLACRYQVMTNNPPPHGKGYKCRNLRETMEYAMLGEIDNIAEMTLMCEEILGRTTEKERICKKLSKAN
jgi:hypothetical protein